MSGRADACSSVDAHAHVALAPDGRLTGVDSHSDTQLDPVRPHLLGKSLLAGHRRRNRVLCAPKRHEERVTLRVDLTATVLGKRLPQDAPVLVERLPIQLAA